MIILLRFIDYCIFFYLITCISGCSNKSLNNNICVSNLNSVYRESCHKLQEYRKENTLHNCNITRFDNKYCFVNDNIRYDYNLISRGSCPFLYYTVKPGDTLFYIAWITGNDYHFLAKRNNININDILRVGQILDVSNEKGNISSSVIRSDVKKKNDNSKKNLNRSFLLDVGKSNSVRFNSVNSKKSRVLNNNFISVLSSSKNHNCDLNSSISDKADIISNKSKVISSMSSVKKNKRELSISWGWPTQGKIISHFSSSEGGNKGIDISGIAGQPIFSAGSGKVVYAGDALFGYGNLIIIKHNNDFLSTYAHNDKILVIEQQNVFLGQKIATMGNSSSDMVKLHFEIRYRGKSVDPLYYLPKQ